MFAAARSRREHSRPRGGLRSLRLVLARNQHVCLCSVRAPRIALICAIAFLVALAVSHRAATARADDIVESATVNADHVHVRAGPGTNYYATEILRRNDRVQVCGHDADGWCRIRPPLGSFSWIAADSVSLGANGTARIAADRAEAHVGNRFDDRRDAVQVLLDRDEEVTLLPGQAATSVPAASWLKIEPPAGEYRWVHEHYLKIDSPSSSRSRGDTSRDRNTENRRRRSTPDDRDADLASRPRDADVRRVGYEQSVPPPYVDSPSFDGAGSSYHNTRDLSPYDSSPRDRRTSALLDELETEVAEIAAGTTAPIDLAGLEEDARDAWRHARTPGERERAENLVRRVAYLSDSDPRAAPAAAPQSAARLSAAPPPTYSRATSVAPAVVYPDSALPQPIMPQAPLTNGIVALAQFLSPTPPPAGPIVQPLPPPGVATTVTPAPMMYPPPPGGSCDPPPAIFSPYGPYGPPPTRHYISLDALGWWMKHDQIPALVTTSPIGTPQASAGVLGLPTTSVLFGNQNINGGARPGGRVFGGVWLDPYQRFAIEGSYWALATASTEFQSLSVFSGGAMTDAILARPYFDNAPAVNAQRSVVIAYPNYVIPPAVNLDGAIDVRESSNVQSASGGGRIALNPYSYPARFFLIGAYRYLSLNETLTVTTSTNPGTGPFPPGRIDSFDNFAATNTFNGGEIGLGTEMGINRLSLIADTRLAMGNMHETLSIDGRTSAIAGGFVASYEGGLLAQPTNIGNYSRDAFVLIPQVDLKLAYQLRPALRLTAGYSFLYVTRAVRPGAQVDTTVNSTQFAGGTLVGPASPHAPFSDTGVWLQGVTAGFDLRF